MEDQKEYRIQTKTGGYLIPQQKGKPAPANAGRKPNPFKKHIHDLADVNSELIVKGHILDKDGNPTGETAMVSVTLPGALAVVVNAYKLACKGDANARRWLTDVGYGKTFSFDSEPDESGSSGFVLVLPPNNR